MSAGREARDWTVGKRRHLELSEHAASEYDKIYEQANFATGSYMRYELEVLRQATEHAPDTEVALDLGCGTGRDTFELAKRFRQVFGYDFSRAMIASANRNKYRRSAGNVSFAVNDVELGIPDFAGESASLVNSAFGMGSFVDRIDDFFLTVRRVLKPCGIAVFSFYNDRALVNQLDLEWRPALAARANPGQDTLTVDFGGQVYEIAARLYDPADLKHKLARNFELLHFGTFPTLTALLPQGVLEDENARQLCRTVDSFLAVHEQVSLGPYIVAIARKPGRKRTSPTDTKGYDRVLELFRTHNINMQVVEHAPVRSMDDVKAIFPTVDPSSMVKSILVILGEEKPGRDVRANRLVLCAIPADRRLDFSKLARLMESPRDQAHMATPAQVEQLTGFAVGSVPPFAMPPRIPVIVDERLTHVPEIWCGTGKSTESIRLVIGDLRRLSNYTVEDISSADGRSWARG